MTVSMSLDVDLIDMVRVSPKYRQTNVTATMDVGLDWCGES